MTTDGFGYPAYEGLPLGFSVCLGHFEVRPALEFHHARQGVQGLDGNRSTGCRDAPIEHSAGYLPQMLGHATISQTLDTYSHMLPDMQGEEILGHARISETMDTYSHYLPDMQEEAMGKLGRLLT